MFVRTLDELEKLGRIKFPADASFRSARFLTAADGVGFSYNENRVKAGTNLVVWLKHHWEANYIVSGRGEVTDLTSGESWPLEAGVLYVVGPNDRHRLHLTEDECHVSIFCPPLTGEERFDEDGSYEASGPIEATDRRMFVKRVDEMRRAGKEMITANGQARTIPMLTKGRRCRFRLVGRAPRGGGRGDPLVQAPLAGEPHHFRRRRGDRSHQRPDLGSSRPRWPTASGPRIGTACAPIATCIF